MMAMASLTVNTRHFIHMARLNCTVIYKFDSTIITPFIDKETKAERVLSNLTRHSQVTKEPHESKSYTLTHCPLSFPT